MRGETAVHPYKKSVRFITIGAAIIVTPLIAGRIFVDLQRGDLVTAAVTGLFLFIPTTAVLGVRRRYVLTDDVLARECLFGRREVRWTAVVSVAEKVGFFQEVLRLTDSQSRTLEVPYEQLVNGDKLYRDIKARTGHAKWK